jgi:hypothetical protein
MRKQRKNEVIAYSVLSIVVAAELIFAYGGWRANQVNRQAQIDFIAKLEGLDIEVTKATITEHSPTLIVRLSESEFLAMAQHQTVYHSGFRFVIYSSDWQIQYEYQTTIWIVYYP